MSLCLKSSLLKLARLSANLLHKTAVRIRKALAGAEWKMGVCLLAVSRNNRYRELGFSSVLDYAERSLKLSRKKAYLLLATARALEHLPLASAAYQEAEICWSKMRSLQSVLTPETEAEWLKFAFDRNANEVSRVVAMSPTAWKGQMALEASKAAAPMATEEAVRDIIAGATRTEDSLPSDALPVPTSTLAPPEVVLEDFLMEVIPILGTSPTEDTALVPRGDQITGNGVEAGAAQNFVKPTIFDGAPKKIRLTIELTPDQYAVFEVAQRHARARMGRQANIAQVLVHMSEHLLDSGAARTRAKHQIIIHTTPEQEHGWYQTDKGPLPVSEEIWNQAKAVSLQPISTVSPKRAGGSKTAAIASHEKEPNRETGTSRETEPNHGNESRHESRSSHQNESSRPKDRRRKTRTKLEIVRDRTPGASRRKNVAMPTLRAVFKRASHCCERCGDNGLPLQVHHRRPVSEGGTNDLEALELLCPACHTGHHETDFAAKPHWAAARSKAIARTKSMSDV